MEVTFFNSWGITKMKLKIYSQLNDLMTIKKNY